MFSLYISERQIRVDQTDLLVSDSINVYQVRFHFSKEWNGLSKTVVFKTKDTALEILLDETLSCNIPYECLLGHNTELYVGCYGMRGEDLLLNTTWRSLGKIREGAKNVDVHPQEPTPDVYQQILSKMGNLEDLETSDKSSLVNAINEVQRSIGSGTSPDGPLPTGVASFNSRTGDVMPMAGDYTAAMVGATPVEDFDNLSVEVETLKQDISKIESQPGPPGKDGLSAYEIAVENGFIGDQEEWLESLKGDTGPSGLDGKDGIDGKDGLDGAPGQDGKSAYQIALDNGFIGTEEEWLDSLKGEPGPPGDSASGGGIPSGCILIWSGASDAVPDGWTLCDGENGTPDLRDRFVLGVGDSYSVGETGGAEEVTLTVDQMPSHAHSIQKNNTSVTIAQGSSSSVRVYSTAYINTGYTGGSQPHPNMPPYYALCYIMKL